MSSKESQYIYTLRPTRLKMLSDGPTADESKILQRHVAYLQRLAQANAILIAGRTQTWTPVPDTDSNLSDGPTVVYTLPVDGDALYVRLSVTGP